MLALVIPNLDNQFYYPWLRLGSFVKQKELNIKLVLEEWRYFHSAICKVGQVSFDVQRRLLKCHKNTHKKDEQIWKGCTNPKNWWLADEWWIQKMGDNCLPVTFYVLTAWGSNDNWQLHMYLTILSQNNSRFTKTEGQTTYFCNV